MIITDVTKIGDPMVVAYNGKYYAYMSDCCDGRYAEGYFVRESTDLLHWSERKPCFSTADGWGENSYWAPEVVYHKGKFIMHYSCRSRSLHSLRIGVAVSDSPFGPFRDIHGGPMFDLGYATIDASVLISRKGNYLYYSRDCGENKIDGIWTSQLYCVRLNEELTEAVGEHRLIATPELPFERKLWKTEKGELFLWNEGPCVIEYEGQYLMNYSANFYATNDYCICMAIAEDPMGPWVKAESNPVLDSEAEMFGAGHNYLFRDNTGVLRTSFHIQTSPDHPSGDRRMVIGRVIISKDETGNLTEQITD